MLAGLFFILFKMISHVLLVFLVPLNTEMMFPENNSQRFQDYFSALKSLFESSQLYICMDRVIPLTMCYFTFIKTDFHMLF